MRGSSSASVPLGALRSGADRIMRVLARNDGAADGAKAAAHEAKVKK